MLRRTTLPLALGLGLVFCPALALADEAAPEALPTAPAVMAAIAEAAPPSAAPSSLLAEGPLTEAPQEGADDARQAPLEKEATPAPPALGQARREDSKRPAPADDEGYYCFTQKPLEDAWGGYDYWLWSIGVPYELPCTTTFRAILPPLEIFKTIYPKDDDDAKARRPAYLWRPTPATYRLDRYRNGRWFLYLLHPDKADKAMYWLSSTERCAWYSYYMKAKTTYAEAYTTYGATIDSAETIQGQCVADDVCQGPEPEGGALIRPLPRPVLEDQEPTDPPLPDPDDEDDSPQGNVAVEEDDEPDIIDEPDQTDDPGGSNSPDTPAAPPAVVTPAPPAPPQDKGDDSHPNAGDEPPLEEDYEPDILPEPDQTDDPGGSNSPDTPAAPPAIVTPAPPAPERPAATPSRRSHSGGSVSGPAAPRLTPPAPPLLAPAAPPAPAPTAPVAPAPAPTPIVSEPAMSAPAPAPAPQSALPPISKPVPKTGAPCSLAGLFLAAAALLRRRSF